MLSDLGNDLKNILLAGIGAVAVTAEKADEVIKELVKKGYGNKAIGEKIGLPGFIAGKYVTQASHFSKSMIRQALEECVSTEEAIKTGKISDNIGLEMIIIRYSTAA